MENIFNQKATRELTPSKRGAKLVSLDNNHTKKYNYDNELMAQINHLNSEVKFRLKVPALWRTPKELYNKNQSSKNNDESSSFHLCSFRGIDYLPRGCRLVAKTPHALYNKINDCFYRVVNNKATRELCPHKSGAKLVSLDNNYTKKYNYIHNSKHSNHLNSEVKFRLKVPALWRTSKELYNKINDYFYRVVNNKATGELCPHKSGAKLVSLDNNYTKKYNYEHNMVQKNHLQSEVEFSHRVAALWRTPRNYTKKLSKFFIPFILSTQLFASGIPTVDVAAIAQQLMGYQQQIKDYAMQLQQYQQLYSQLQQQIQMVKMQTQNLKTLSSYDWQNLNVALYQARNIMQKVDGISYDLGNVSRKFEETYKDFNRYSSDINSAKDENARNKIFSDRYKQIQETNQNTLNGTLQKLELANKEFENEDRIISDLKNRSQNAEGNLQAIQATNDLLVYQVDEARKLRVAIMDLTNALANYMASQNNEKILQQAKIDKFLENAENAGSSWGKSNHNALKWK
ncbi:P-type conjugative transfer protein TrbJ [Campylobacter hyointestinalis]|uniref:P-type conjugative transfer protein TrbJ n=1 Tax=Campylobacter hyointestinalis TaxID=198 RepID=UPI002157016D|nr:P-type conjugative transfer protein TrbJ [Campylobacter hyointestinalis]